MSADAKPGNLRSSITFLRPSAHQSSTQFVQLAQLRKLRGSEQVAAVCYRIGSDGIEFLLIRTRGRRWIFPKGHAEPGLTHAQAAALEAFEEAGVHGRIEEAPFARFTRRQRGASIDIGVSVHLCEVSWLDQPMESGRNPTWFPVEKTKRRLRADRPAAEAEDMVNVIDRAVARIQRFRGLISRLAG